MIPEVIVSVNSSEDHLEFKMPTHCPVCGTAVQQIEGEVGVKCPNRRGCAAQLKGAILHLAGRKAMDIAKEKYNG